MLITKCGSFSYKHSLFQKVCLTYEINMVALATVLSFGIASAQTGLGFQAGYSMHKSTQKDSKALNGFHVGPTYEMGIQGPISLQYGLLYNFATRSENSVSLTSHALDIPVRVAATFPVGNSLSAFVFGGPNFNIGLSNNLKVGDVSTDLYKDTEIAGVTIKGMSRFDLQLGLGAGLKYNNMGVRVSYDFGMLNRVKDVDSKVNDLKVGLFYNF